MVGVGLDVEEVAGLEVAVAVGAAGVDGLATWMVRSTLDAGGFASSMWAVPSKSPNWPRTLVTMAWRATKPRRLWLVSMV